MLSVVVGAPHRTRDRSNAAEMTIDLENRELRVPGMEPVAFELADERRVIVATRKPEALLAALGAQRFLWQ